MVAGLSVTELVSWGVLIYAFSVLLVPMGAELGWTLAEMNGAYGLGLAVSGLAAIPVGRWLQAHGARVLMTVGSAATAVALLSWSQVQSLPGLYAVFAIAGLAMATTLYEPAFAVTTAWFTVHRSRAVLVLTVAAGLSSFVFLPLTGLLVTEVGWRDTLLALACIAAVVGLPIHSLLLRRRPADLGLHPDGRRSPQPTIGGTRGGRGASATGKQAVLSRSFRWLAASLAFATAGKIAVTVVLVAYLTDRGYPLATAALIAGAIGGFQVAGRLLVTALRRRVPEHRATAILFTAQGLALTLPLTTTGTDTAATVTVALFVALFGLGFGLPELLRGTLVADYYGAAVYAEVNGVLAAVVTAARAGAPFLAGLVVTTLDSYTPVFLAAAVGALASAVTLALADRSHQRERLSMTRAP